MGAAPKLSAQCRDSYRAAFVKGRHRKRAEWTERLLRHIMAYWRTPVTLCTTQCLSRAGSPSFCGLVGP